MSVQLVRWSATIGVQLVGTIARLLGARVASALFVSATGRVLLRLLVHTVGGPLALIPQSVLASAVNSVVPSPVVLLRGIRAGVRVVYVLLETPLAQGAKRVLVRLGNPALQAAIPEQRAQWLKATQVEALAIDDEYAPSVRHLHVAAPAPVASAPLRVHDLDAEKSEKKAPEPSASLTASGLAPSSPIVLELNEDALAQVEAHFDGERANVEASDLPAFLRERGRDDEAALSASRMVAGEARLDETWQPAELLLQSRVRHRDELSATLRVGDHTASNSSSNSISPSPSQAPAREELSADEGWVALEDLCPSERIR